MKLTLKAIAEFAVRNNLISLPTLRLLIEKAWPVLSKSKRIVRLVRDEYVVTGMEPEYVEKIATSDLCYVEEVIDQYLHRTKGFGDGESMLDIPAECFLPDWCPRAFSYHNK